MVNGFLGTDMTREEFMDRLREDQNLMWAIEEQLAEKDRQIEQLEKREVILRHNLILARHEHHHLASSTIALVRAICDHLGIEGKYSLQDCWAASEDHGGLLLEETWKIAEMLDWRECPQ